MACSRHIHLILLVCIAGCASVSTEQKQVYEDGYRAGVREQMHKIAGQFQGGNFPYYHWTSPIVQEVEVPGHISNGVFIPLHKELVIIKPGEWAQSPAYPIESSKETHETTARNVALGFSDITHLPNSSSSSGDVGTKGKDSGVASGVVEAK